MNDYDILREKGVRGVLIARGLLENQWFYFLHR